MNFSKSASVVAFSLVALTAGAPSSGAIILNSSQLSLQASAWANAGWIYDEDVQELQPSDTLITSFNDAISAAAMDADPWYYDPDYSEYADQAEGWAGAGLNLNVQIGDSSSVFDVYGTAYGGGSGWQNGTSGALGQMNYVANFTLTSAYTYDLSVALQNQVPLLSDEFAISENPNNFLRLRSLGIDYYLSASDTDVFESISGVLPAGDYDLFGVISCPGIDWTFDGYGRSGTCTNHLDFTLHLSAIAEVPLPPTFLLIASGLLGLIGIGGRGRAHS